MVQLPSQVMLGLHFVWNKKNNICLCIDIKNNHQYYSDVMICFFYSWCIKHADTCTFNLICWLYLDFQWCLLLILMFPCCRSGGWGGRDGFWDGGVLDQAACPHGAGTEALQGQSLTLVPVDYNPFHCFLSCKNTVKNSVIHSFNTCALLLIPFNFVVYFGYRSVPRPWGMWWPIKRRLLTPSMPWMRMLPWDPKITSMNFISRLLGAPTSNQGDQVSSP